LSAASPCIQLLASSAAPSDISRAARCIVTTSLQNCAYVANVRTLRIGFSPTMISPRAPRHVAPGIFAQLN
jgi:hypothetical protein